MRRQGHTSPLDSRAGLGEQGTPHPETLGRCERPSCGLLLAAHPRFSNTGCSGAAICTTEFLEHLLCARHQAGCWESKRGAVSSLWELTFK